MNTVLCPCQGYVGITNQPVNSPKIVHVRQPRVARYVRLLPTEFNGGAPSLRWDIHGCAHTGQKHTLVTKIFTTLFKLSFY